MKFYHFQNEQKLDSILVAKKHIFAFDSLEHLVDQCITTRTSVPILSFGNNGNIDISLDHRYILNDYDHTDTTLLARISLKPKQAGTEFDPANSLRVETVDSFPSQNKIKIYLPEIEAIINADTDEKMNLLADSPERTEGAKDEIDAFTIIPPFLLDYFCMCEAFEAKSMLDSTLRIFKANYYTHTKSGSIKVHQHSQVKKIILFLFLALKIDRDDGEFVTEDDLQKCICPTTRLKEIENMVRTHTFFSLSNSNLFNYYPLQ